MSYLPTDQELDGLRMRFAALVGGIARSEIEYHALSQALAIEPERKFSRVWEMGNVPPMRNRVHVHHDLPDSCINPEQIELAPVDSYRSSLREGGALSFPDRIVEGRLLPATLFAFLKVRHYLIPSAWLERTTALTGTVYRPSEEGGEMWCLGFKCCRDLRPGALAPFRINMVSVPLSRLRTPAHPLDCPLFCAVLKE